MGLDKWWLEIYYGMDTYILQEKSKREFSRIWCFHFQAYNLTKIQ